MTLDGELFCGRGQFDACVSIVKTSGSSRWGEDKYQVSIVFLITGIDLDFAVILIMCCVPGRSSTPRLMEVSPLRPAWIMSVLSLAVFSQPLLTSSSWTRLSELHVVENACVSMKRDS